MSAERDARRAKVIEVLNIARSMELQAVHQYMNQHYNLDDKDYGTLAANMKLIAIDEMRHAESFAERIKELGGEPTSDLKAPITKGQDVHQIYNFDAASEDNTIDAYNSFLKVCNENGDNVSVRLFENIIEQEQAHLTYYENVAGHIKTLGDTYLSKVAGTSSSTGGASKGFVMNLASTTDA